MAVPMWELSRGCNQMGWALGACPVGAAGAGVLRAWGAARTTTSKNMEFHAVLYIAIHGTRAASFL
eukprot:1403-Pelagomonas_calceolata.AAC.1